MNIPARRLLLLLLPVLITILLQADDVSCAPLWWSAVVPSNVHIKATQTCNGHASLCSRSYADVVFAGAHNSYAFGTGISDNQSIDIDKGLVQGVRLLQAQAHDFASNDTTSPSGISLCHTSCYLQNGGSLEAWLGKARAWLDANPQEVLTLLVTNPDSIDLNRWRKGFEYAGFNATNVFAPPAEHIGRTQWPTLGQLIDSGKRTVVFMDRGADFGQVPWLMSEFANVWENPYDQLELPFNCSVDRGTKEDTLYLHNHVKDLALLGISYPDKDSLVNINAAQNNSNAVVPTVQRCMNETGVKATFVLVDFYDVPAQDNVFSAVDLLNNVSRTADTDPGKSAASSVRPRMIFAMILPTATAILLASLMAY